MNRLCGGLLVGVVLVGSGVAEAQQARLPETLKKLDAASAQFTSVSADFHKDLYTKLIHETEGQDGLLFVVHTGKSGVEAGLKITGPTGARTLLYEKGIGKDDTPGRCYNTVANKQGAIESALTLGFGGSGTDLAKHWDIKDDGPETVKGGEAEKLELTPRDQAVKDTYTRIDLWIRLADGIALEQKSYAVSGDTQTAYYSNIKVGAKVDKGAFAITDPDCSAPGRKK